MLIDRPVPLERIRESFSVHPAVALTGPRQCGKTTLARHVAGATARSSYFDLEAATDRRRLATPEHTLGRLGGLVVIDEIQRMPTLFETVRVLVDRPDNAVQFLLLGSASPSLVKGVSESLAGRVGLVDLAGFDLGEVRADRWRKLWLRGGFPRSYLAGSTKASALWRKNFVRTFLERDIPQLGITIPAEKLRRFWTMIAHYHGQVWNAAEFARSLGTSEGTARNYLDILVGAFMVRVLPPLVREPEEAPSKVAQGLPAGHGPPAYSAGPVERGCSRGAPQGRCLFRGFRHRTAVRRARCTECILLGDPRRCRAGPFRSPKRETVRIRMQILGRAETHPFDAGCTERSAPRSPLGRLSGGRCLCPGREGNSPSGDRGRTTRRDRARPIESGPTSWLSC